MSQTISASNHDDMIHDAVLDYYGRRLATASSDKTIKVFEISGEQHQLSATLKAHDGAVWSVAWAHPKYGTILASSGYDGRVLVWREQQPNQSQASSGASIPGGGGGTQWTRIFDYSLHSASVNLVAWSPPETGAHLAAASSDGQVSVLTLENNAFSHVMFPAHGLGVNAVSWAPALQPGALVSASTSPQTAAAPIRRLATAGSDNLVKIWTYNHAAAGASWDLTVTLPGHTDWVRDVAFSPTPLAKQYVASASQDNTVRIWTCAAGADVADAASWKSEVLNFDVVCWRVSWSMAGNVLAVSGGDNRVSLWKEKLKGGWDCVKTLEE